MARPHGFLDMVPEPLLDDIVLLASQACRTPVALISLVEERRQWFKARVGFEPCETLLDRSVCATPSTILAFWSFPTLRAIHGPGTTRWSPSHLTFASMPVCPCASAMIAR
ncbi:hypothetical protein MKK70_18525 [Methylobacterium sp. E-041]|nr:hypothetical protein [Methylobacterium sp. E-041]MCJ2107343.1 hypothetical protein [Methylobacterium sp. E-041]